jgi:hypothetical protein
MVRGRGASGRTKIAGEAVTFKPDALGEARAEGHRWLAQLVVAIAHGRSGALAGQRPRARAAATATGVTGPLASSADAPPLGSGLPPRLEQLAQRRMSIARRRLRAAPAMIRGSPAARERRYGPHLAVSHPEGPRPFVFAEQVGDSLDQRAYRWERAMLSRVPERSKSIRGPAAALLIALGSSALWMVARADSLMLYPRGPGGGAQHLVLVVKTAKGPPVTVVESVRFVPMRRAR